MSRAPSDQNRAGFSPSPQPSPTRGEGATPFAWGEFPPLVPSPLRGGGLGRGGGSAHACAITSFTASTLPNTSVFQNLSTRKPCDSSQVVRCASYGCRSACCPPSSSTISRASKHTKSTTYRPMGTCRRNLRPSKRAARNCCHKTHSASVEPFRNWRAKEFMPVECGKALPPLPGPLPPRERE